MSVKTLKNYCKSCSYWPSHSSPDNSPELIFRIMKSRNQICSLICVLNMSNESFMKKNTYFFSSKIWFKSMFLYFAKLKNITYLIFMINSNDDITCFCICCWTWVRFWLNFWFKSIFLYFAIKQDWNSSSIKKWTENIR